MPEFCTPSFEPQGRLPVRGGEIIRIHDAYDVRDWAIYFSVSQERIRAAVAAVGPWAQDVRRYLGK